MLFFLLSVKEEPNPEALTLNEIESLTLAFYNKRGNQEKKK